MISYADTEYEAGLYRQYVEARDMKMDHFRSRLRLLAPCLRVGKLLDVGCSCGYFMEVGFEEGFDVHGLEFSREAIAYARPFIQSRITRASIEALEGSDEYDLITAFDLIEHVARPLEFLSKARQLLKPGGILVISTPDADHFLRHVMGSHWPMLQPMQHLAIFGRRAMATALQRAGFEQITFQPATKTLTFEYLIDQLRTLTPALHLILGTIGKGLPKSFMKKYRHINIGEFLVIAKRNEEPKGSS